MEGAVKKEIGDWIAEEEVIKINRKKKRSKDG